MVLEESRKEIKNYIEFSAFVFAWTILREAKDRKEGGKAHDITVLD